MILLIYPLKETETMKLLLPLLQERGRGEVEKVNYN
jgi:hypothetical protein